MKTRIKFDGSKNTYVSPSEKSNRRWGIGVLTVVGLLIGFCGWEFLSTAMFNSNTPVPPMVLVAFAVVSALIAILISRRRV